MRRAFFFTFSLLLTACATTHHGPMQRLSVTSEPAGAVVTIQNCGAFATSSSIQTQSAEVTGNSSTAGSPSSLPPHTPAVVWVSRRATQCTLSVAMPGYKVVSVKLSRHVAQQFTGNTAAMTVLCSEELLCNSLGDLAAAGIIGSVLAGAGMATDAVTGSMFELRPNRVDVFLCTSEEPCSGGLASQTADLGKLP